MSPIFLAGPCVIENAELLDVVAQRLVAIREKLRVEVYFKASFDKANRTSLRSFRGPGLEKGLQMLADIKERYQLPLTTDVHETYQAAAVGEVVDVLQIPAFLCRQTDLLVASSQTGRVVNVKKSSVSFWGRYAFSRREMQRSWCERSVVNRTRYDFWL